MKALLVASRGGHLQQLKFLVKRFSPSISQSLWVSDEGAVELEELRLAGERVAAARTPTRRHVPNMIRNYILAGHLIRDFAPDVVVSTGAALAPPFMIAAKRAGVEAVYIESATFESKPSLSARIVSMIPGVRRYYQTDSVAFGSGWEPIQSPFDAFRVARRSGSTGVERVLVSLGTQTFPFYRLVHGLEQVLQGRHVEVTWQLGSSMRGHRPALGEVVQFMTSEEWMSVAAAADVVVGHAGTGLVLSSLSAGKLPVVCGRDPDRGEHIDAHQHDTVVQVQRRGLAIVVEPEDLTFDVLEEAASYEVLRVDSLNERIVLLR